ncbi:cytochrome P450 [Mycena belliarum]|uniref:Cytochrome P450 n=1 Tax=Mycena belliarum TaxID=1033014 RepID=A0AAD6TZA4_9AGAR|nr:cytochrome P450 [Mycena belliae]
MLWSAGETPLLIAVFAGVASWRTLNRFTVRGDYALVLLSASLVGMYLCVPLNLSIVFFTSLVLSTLAYRLSPLHPLASYPGPVTWRFSSMVLAAISSTGYRHLILHELHKKYGDFVRIGPNVLSINSFNAASVIYGPKLLKGDAYTSPGHTGDVALFFKQDPSVHSKRKVLWTNALSNSAIQGYHNAFAKRTDQLVQCIESRLNEEGEVNLSDCINHWTFDVMGDVMFGGAGTDLELMRDGDPGGLVQIGKRSEAGLDSLGHIPWLLDIMWYASESDAVNLRRLREVCGSMMRSRLQHKNVDKQDLTSYFLDHDIRVGDRPTPSDMELEALVAVQGGSDNPGSQLIMAMFLLITNPNVLRTLQTQLDDIFPESTQWHLDPRALAFPYLDAVINETFRLSSPWLLPRVVPKGGIVIDGCVIPEDTIVALASYSQHISEDNFFPDPLSFRPERWLPGGLGPGSVLKKTALTTFTAGPHACPGKNFAMVQMRHLIARLVLNFDLALCPHLSPEEFMKGFKNIRSNIFDEPLMVTVTERRGGKNATW